MAAAEPIAFIKETLDKPLITQENADSIYKKLKAELEHENEDSKYLLQII